MPDHLWLLWWAVYFVVDYPVWMVACHYLFHDGLKMFYEAAIMSMFTSMTTLYVLDYKGRKGWR